MLRLDFISDINCPWCALGLANLKAALANLGDEIKVDLHFQPFELNPQLPREGVDLVDYLRGKYGMTAEQIEANHTTLRERGAEVGFVFGKRDRLWNSFDAHRLLYWAAQEGKPESQQQLKTALMQAYQGEGRNHSDAQVLIELAGQSGLDKTRAQAILASDEYVREVRELEQQWQSAGISAVPSLVINRKHLIQGAQPSALIEQALRDINAQVYKS
ncbi:MAG: DsbA family oxidoreductase [Cellvibrio sp.]|uniref:DsbA family oxidoreductase n=1 Tax=Cellvibrio sp. TaxID=1965322 RepID=UPI0031A865F6